MVEAERRERRSLGLIAQVSDLLMDVDDPHALREIAAILRRAVVGWAAFYLNDGGLRVADGIDAGRPPTGKGSRHGEGPTAAGRAGPTPSSSSSTPRSTGPSSWRSAARYGLGSASAWLAQQAETELGRRRRRPTSRSVARASRCPAAAGCSGCSSCTRTTATGCAAWSRPCAPSWT